MRNTVTDAMRTWERLKSACDAIGLPAPLLLHSRFVPGDRQQAEDAVLKVAGKETDAASRRGRLVVATQVAEQSLDFDAMIVDAAPIDALIQRIGRWRRHARTAMGDPAPDGAERRGPGEVLLRCAPLDAVDATWLAKLSQGAAAVYQDAARVWFGAALLMGHRDVADKPLDPARYAKRLVEEVYAPDEALRVWLLPALAKALDAPKGQRFAMRNRARDEGIGFGQGLLRDWNDGGDLADVEGAMRLSSGARLVLAVRDGSETRFLKGAVPPAGLADPVEEATVPTPFRTDAEAQRKTLAKEDLEALERRLALALGITPTKAALRLEQQVIVLLKHDHKTGLASGMLQAVPETTGHRTLKALQVAYDKTRGLQRIQST